MLKTVSWNVPPYTEFAKCCYLILWAALFLALIRSLFTGTQSISFINRVVFGCAPKMATHIANTLPCDILRHSWLLYVFPLNIFTRFTVGNCLTICYICPWRNCHSRCSIYFIWRSTLEPSFLDRIIPCFSSVQLCLPETTYLFLQILECHFWYIFIAGYSDCFVFLRLDVKNMRLKCVLIISKLYFDLIKLDV